MRYRITALLLVAGCERAHPTYNVTAHYPWSNPPRVGDTIASHLQFESTLTRGTKEHHGTYTNDLTLAVLEVKDERMTRVRVEVKRDEHSLDGEPDPTNDVGVFEAIGDPITEVRRLDGELTKDQRKFMMEMRNDCPPSDGHMTAERLYRRGETVRVPDAEAKCMGFSHAVPGSLEMTLRSFDGTTTEFEYSVDYVPRESLPQSHATGAMTLTKTTKTSHFDVKLVAEGEGSAVFHIETSARFTPGPPS